MLKKGKHLLLFFKGFFLCEFSKCDSLNPGISYKMVSFTPPCQLFLDICSEMCLIFQGQMFFLGIHITAFYNNVASVFAFWAFLVEPNPGAFTRLVWSIWSECSPKSLVQTKQPDSGVDHHWCDPICTNCCNFFNAQKNISNMDIWAEKKISQLLEKVSKNTVAFKLLSKRNKAESIKVLSSVA